MKIPTSIEVRSDDLHLYNKVDPIVYQRRQGATLRSSVKAAVSDYFEHVDPDMIKDFYNLVLAEVEAPMLEVVMNKVRQNQSKAAKLLGLNRGTLRTKLKQYKLLD
jgi:Fis family transcriptional regulator, factor for inversion stimulation protein